MLRIPAVLAASLVALVAGCGSGSSLEVHEIGKGGAGSSAAGSTLADISGITNASTMDASFLYLALQDNVAPRIVRVSKATGAISDVTPTGVFVEGLCVDDDHLYFTTLDTGGDVHAPTGTISRVDKSGGAAEVIATGQYRPWGIACGANDLYWANQGMEIGEGSVMSMPKSGGDVTTVVANETQTEEVVVIDAQTIAWGNGPLYPADGAVKTMSLAAGATPTTLTGPVGFVRSLTARGRALSWIGDGTLQRYSLDDGSMSSIFIGDQQAATMDLATLYWGIDDQNQHGAVEKLSRGATTPVTLLAGPSLPGNEVTSGWMTGLLVDDQTVFAIDYYAQYSDGMHTTIRHAQK